MGLLDRLLGRTKAPAKPKAAPRARPPRQAPPEGWTDTNAQKSPRWGGGWSENAIGITYDPRVDGKKTGHLVAARREAEVLTGSAVIHAEGGSRGRVCVAHYRGGQMVGSTVGNNAKGGQRSSVQAPRAEDTVAPLLAAYTDGVNPVTFAGVHFDGLDASRPRD